jgi:hypothetical protein
MPFVIVSGDRFSATAGSGGFEPPRAASKAAMLPVTSAPTAALVRARESNSELSTAAGANTRKRTEKYRHPEIRRRRRRHAGCVRYGRHLPASGDRSAIGMTARPRDTGRCGRWFGCLAFTDLPSRSVCTTRVRRSSTLEQWISGPVPSARDHPRYGVPREATQVRPMNRRVDSRRLDRRRTPARCAISALSTSRTICPGRVN